MKKFALLTLCYFFTLNTFSQSTFSWRNDQNPTSGQWNVANYWWNGGGAALPGGSEILYLDGSVGTAMTNDLPSTNRYRIIFGSGGASRTIGGSIENTFYDYSTNKPKIENNSSNLQTIAFPLKWGYTTCELNPVNGNLSITSAINNNGNWTDVWGSAGTSLTLAGGMSGTGGLSLKSTTTVYITSPCTYTGNTYIDYGTLEISGDIASTNITVANGTTLRITGTDVDIQGLTINSGGTVEVAAGKSLTINGALINNGTLNLKSNSTDGTATLKTLSTVTNGGANNYNIEQYLSAGRNWYISSPVSTAVNTVITGTSGNVLYYRNEPANSWPTDATTFTVGNGYIASIGASNGGTYTFNGSISNNEPTISLTRSVVSKAGFNLVGNPYPCYYVWNKAQADASNLLYTVWYRTKEGSYTFHTFNVNGEISSPLSVSNYIPPMQAFWVRVDTDSDGSEDLTFLKANRSHADAPTNKLKANKVETNKILRLDVSNKTNSDETVLYFNNNAADTYDGFDSPKMTNSLPTVPEIYTITNTEQLVINGMQNIPLDTEIPLGFRTQETNTFIIKATEISGFDPSIKIFLKDNQNSLNPEQELTPETSYSFTSDIIDNTSRFSIIFKSTSVTTSLSKPIDSEKITIFANENNKITVNLNSALSKSYSLEVFNSYGQKIAHTETKNSTETINKQFDSGVYFVKISINEKTSTHKVIIR